MKKLIRFAVTAAAVAATMTPMPASATECTPKGCTGGCHVGDLRDASIDGSGNITLGRPIECYS